MTGLAHVLDVLARACAELRALLPDLTPGLALAVEVEVRRIEADLASLRDQLAARDLRSRLVITIARYQPVPFAQRDPAPAIATQPTSRGTTP